MNLPEVSLFDLLNAVNAILKRVESAGGFARCVRGQMDCQRKDRADRQDHQGQAARVKFSDLFAGAMSRTEVVVTFLALLELIRLKQIQAAQSEDFGEIEIVAVSANGRAPATLRRTAADSGGRIQPALDEIMELKNILEAVLFSAQKPMSTGELRELFVEAATTEDSDATAKSFKKVKEDALEKALEELAAEHEAAARTYRLVCVAGAWQFVSQPEYAPWLKALVGHKARLPKLSQPTLETLAIIAYRQPITRAEIEQVRGVAVDGVMQTLVERGLVEQDCRAEVIGRPMTYGKTTLFMEYFCLKNLEELPAADELRRIPIVKPEGLETVDPGLATAPPDQLQLPAEQQPAEKTETAEEPK